VSGSADKLMLLAAHYMLLSLDISYGKRSLYFSSTEMYHLESFDLKISTEVLTAKGIAVILDPCLSSSRVGANLTPETLIGLLYTRESPS